MEKTLGVIREVQVAGKRYNHTQMNANRVYSFIMGCAVGGTVVFALSTIVGIVQNM